MPGYSSALQFIAACWLAFVSVWLVASLSTKRTVYRESAGARARYWLLLVIAYVLLTQGRRFPYPLSLIIIPRTALSDWIGAVLCGCGLAIAIWARLILGRNWSGVVTLKENHERVQHGPYRFVRHPIYTGLIVMALGTAVNYGRAIGFALLAALCGGLWWKARQEERIMSAHFPDAYAAYKLRVRAIIPFVL